MKLTLHNSGTFRQQKSELPPVSVFCSRSHWADAIRPRCYRQTPHKTRTILESKRLGWRCFMRFTVLYFMYYIMSIVWSTWQPFLLISVVDFDGTFITFNGSIIWFYPLFEISRGSPTRYDSHSISPVQIWSSDSHVISKLPMPGCSGYFGIPIYVAPRSFVF